MHCIKVEHTTYYISLLNNNSIFPNLFEFVTFEIWYHLQFSYIWYLSIYLLHISFHKILKSTTIFLTYQRVPIFRYIIKTHIFPCVIIMFSLIPFRNFLGKKNFFCHCIFSTSLTKLFIFWIISNILLWYQMMMIINKKKRNNLALWTFNQTW